MSVSSLGFNCFCFERRDGMGIVLSGFYGYHFCLRTPATFGVDSSHFVWAVVCRLGFGKEEVRLGWAVLAKGVLQLWSGGGWKCGHLRA